MSTATRVVRDAPTVDPDRQTLTVEEAAVVLGIGRGLAYEAARRGELPTLRLGRRLIVPVVALQRMLATAASAAVGDGDRPPA